MSPLLSVKDLTKVYPGKPPCLAVNSISFSLKKGEILGLLGPNGSGKTTTIQMLLGTLSPTSGEIAYFGKDFARHRSEAMQSISFASTYTGLPFILSMEENLTVYGLLYGLSSKESKARYLPLLQRFGIAHLRGRRVAELSAGQLTRLMLVKAFFIGPKIVLLDEPTASLDPDVSLEVCEFLSEERKRTELSILFTSHKMEEVAEVCDRVIFLKEGKIIADDVPKKLAESVSHYRLRLVLSDGLKRTQAIAEKMGCTCKLDHRMIDISIEQEKIPRFLNALGKDNIDYTTIHIEEPSLEDYFLEVSKR